MSELIFHACKEADWAEALRLRRYEGSRDDLRDGFIHFSKAHQMAESLAKHRRQEEGLVLIACDPMRMGAKSGSGEEGMRGLKWEPGRYGELFPHNYGPLNFEAIEWWCSLRLDHAKTHILPNLELRRGEASRLASIYKCLRPAIFRVDAEKAHNLTISALSRMTASSVPKPRPALFTSLWGRTLSNPVGMAAGFDKNAQAQRALFSLGFGFVEVGSITPRPQAGNPKPRMFRLKQDRSVINRLGFNNRGMADAARRLEAFRRDPFPGLLGVNIGKNKQSSDAAADYRVAAAQLSPFSDYLVINVSSPNTPGLRALQSAEELKRLIGAVREVIAPNCPLVLKVAPDLTEEDVEEIAKTAQDEALDGLIVSNTTITRPDNLRNWHKRETGGLSGAALFELSTQVLKRFYEVTEGKIPLIGTGGVSNGAQAYAKIRAGASAIQLYSAMVYEGPGLPEEIKRDLEVLLKRDGFSSVGEAVGADHR